MLACGPRAKAAIRNCWGRGTAVCTVQVHQQTLGIGSRRRADNEDPRLPTGLWAANAVRPVQTTRKAGLLAHFSFYWANWSAHISANFSTGLGRGHQFWYVVGRLGQKKQNSRPAG